MNNDIVDRFFKWFSHNRYKVMAFLVVALLAFWLVGCQPKTISPVSGNQVTWQQLEFEVKAEGASLAAAAAMLDAEAVKFQEALEAFETSTEMARVDLERQYEFRANVFNTIGPLLAGVFTGETSPANVIGAITALGLAGFGGGAFLDGRRKDKVITEQKKELL